MIHIEKLSLKNIGKYTWQTFVDHLLGNRDTRQHILERTRKNLSRDFIATDRLSPYVFSKLGDISIGKYFGFKGADIDMLLATKPNIENLVIEISVDNINRLPKQKLKLLLETYPVMLNDFEECGTLYGPPNPNLIDMLTASGIKPKQLFLVGSCFQLKDYPDLNIYKIPYEYWAMATAVINDTFSKAVFDNTVKQTLIDELDSEPSEFCVVPAFKPRLNRVELLTQLDRKNILDKTDWSLAYNLVKHNYAHTIRYKKTEPYTNEHIEFLSKYTFPKFIEGPVTDWKDLISPLKLWFNRYKFAVSAETYMGHEIPNPMGGCGALTEKTYKNFLNGAAPIIYGPKGSITHLKSYGFKLFMDEYDSTDPNFVSNLLIELYKDPVYIKEHKIHNFELMSNVDFLAGLVCEPLFKIDELINSIRR